MAALRAEDPLPEARKAADRPSGADGAGRQTGDRAGRAVGRDRAANRVRKPERAAPPKTTHRGAGATGSSSS